MTAEQVKFVIEKLGYEMNQLIPLDTVNVIVLEGNYNLYPDSSLRLNFVNKNANVIVGYRGTTDADGNFVPKDKPCFVIPFDQIIAFQFLSPTRGRASYQVGLSC